MAHRLKWFLTLYPKGFAHWRHRCFDLSLHLASWPSVELVELGQQWLQSLNVNRNTLKLIDIPRPWLPMQSVMDASSDTLTVRVVLFEPDIFDAGKSEHISSKFVAAAPLMAQPIRDVIPSERFVWRVEDRLLCAYGVAEQRFQSLHFWMFRSCFVFEICAQQKQLQLKLVAIPPSTTLHVRGYIALSPSCRRWALKAVFSIDLGLTYWFWRDDAIGHFKRRSAKLFAIYDRCVMRFE